MSKLSVTMPVKMYYNKEYFYDLCDQKFSAITHLTGHKQLFHMGNKSQTFTDIKEEHDEKDSENKERIKIQKIFT